MISLPPYFSWYDILEMLDEPKLAGMRAAVDEMQSNGIKRQHPAQQIIDDLLAAEIAEKKARSIRYQVVAAKLPLAKELADSDFTGSPANQGLVRELADGGFLRQQRNAVLVGGTGRQTHPPSPSPATASEPGRDAGSTPWSIWSNRWKPRPKPGAAGKTPIS